MAVVFGPLQQKRYLQPRFQVCLAEEWLQTAFATTVPSLSDEIFRVAHGCRFWTSSAEVMRFAE